MDVPPSSPTDLPAYYPSPLSFLNNASQATVENQTDTANSVVDALKWMANCIVPIDWAAQCGRQVAINLATVLFSNDETKSIFPLLIPLDIVVSIVRILNDNFSRYALVQTCKYFNQPDFLNKTQDLFSLHSASFTLAGVFSSSLSPAYLTNAGQANQMQSLCRQMAQLANIEKTLGVPCGPEMIKTAFEYGNGKRLDELKTIQQTKWDDAQRLLIKEVPTHYVFLTKEPPLNNFLAYVVDGVITIGALKAFPKSYFGKSKDDVFRTHCLDNNDLIVMNDHLTLDVRNCVNLYLLSRPDSTTVNLFAFWKIVTFFSEEVNRARFLSGEKFIF